MARRLGTSISETARLVGCSRSAVVSVFNKWRNQGETTSKRRGVGRPPLITDVGRRRLGRQVKQDRRRTVAELTSDFNAGQSTSVSEHTVHRTLLTMGLRSRRPMHVPMLTPRHRQLRLKWARDHRHWTLAQWQSVAWSDESRYRLHHADGRVRIRRRPGKQLLDTCTAGRRQAGGGSIMLWGTFTWTSMGPVELVQGTMTAETYRTLVADHVHPFMTTMFPNGSGIFQQDNAPCHKARSVMEWFEEHSGELQLMCWPPNSPDLNPIEHIWDVIERGVRAHRPPPRNLRELGDLCVQLWCQLPPATYQGLIASMPRRVAAVIRAHGGHTSY